MENRENSGVNRAAEPPLRAEAVVELGRATMVALLSAIFLASVGAALFTLAIFRLLSFFVMPSMFFALLLVGFPLGAALASRGRDSNLGRFRRVLGMLAFAMVASIVLTLFCKHADYMRAHLLIGVRPGRLLAQVAIFALLYLPFFMAYGAAEYVGYLAGTNLFGQRMRAVYAVCLFGGAVAFIVAATLQPMLGVPRLLLVAIIAVSAGRLLISSAQRWRAVLETSAFVALASWQGFDPMFMNLFKSSAPSSVAANLAAVSGSQVVFAGWGKYAYLEIVRQPLGTMNIFVGHYNDYSQWLSWGGTGGSLPRDVSEMEPRDRVPHLFLPPGGTVAVVGSGGGREVHTARAAGASRILALEIEPQTVQVIRHQLREEFDDVYDKPPLELFVGEARGYFERRDDQFDLIMMMSVGGYPQMMIEPGNMIRTISSYRLLASHLTAQGVLAIGYDTALDPDGVLARQYYHTLRQLGLDCYAYHYAPSFLLLAFRRDASAEVKATWAQARRRLEQDALRLTEEKMAMTDFRPITDDRPYLAGNIRNILSQRQIWWMFSVLGSVLVLAGTVLGMVLHRSLLRRTLPVRPGILLGMGFLLGANFMLLEQLCVIQLFRHMYRYYDSLMIGMVAFLTITGMGSSVLPRRWLPWVVPGTLVLSLICWREISAMPGWWTVAITGPLVLATGTFFPLLFEQAPEGRLQLFSMDALGSAFGAILAFFVPMLYGLQVLSQVALATFIVTGTGTLLYLLYYSPHGVTNREPGEPASITPAPE